MHFVIYKTARSYRNGVSKNECCVKKKKKMIENIILVKTDERRRSLNK